jgi:poly(A) polymerase
MAGGPAADIILELSGKGAAARFIGGCVRDAIVGRSVSDIDLATDAVPDRVVEILGGAGIRTEPTGIEHGTVTAIVRDRPYQITTLRRDVETDGRRAVVSFTTDWAEDAGRRDFTINALSADADGSVYDYVDGLADLAAGRVRFIGAAAERVAEDYLRILRFFRFHAGYASGAPDEEALAACRAAAARIDDLSGERIWLELSRILLIDPPGTVFQMMEKAGVLGRLIPIARKIDRLTALAALEGMIGLDADPIRRLAALIEPTRREASQVAARLRLGRIDTDRLDSLTANRGQCSPDMSEAVLRRSLYRVRTRHFRDLLLLDWSEAIVRDRAAAMRTADGWKKILDYAQAWEQPELPVSGEDVMGFGVPEGPAVGEMLEAIEEWWLERAFKPDREACLDRLRLLARRR